jgi:hypothetical protein
MEGEEKHGKSNSNQKLNEFYEAAIKEGARAGKCQVQEAADI